MNAFTMIRFDRLFWKVVASAAAPHNPSDPTPLIFNEIALIGLIESDLPAPARFPLSLSQMTRS
jgi:hypothetical protein